MGFQASSIGVIVMSRSYKWDFEKAQLPDRELLIWLYKNYVLCCPVKGVSVRNCDFEDLGWSGHKMLTLAAEIKNKSTLVNGRWIWIDGNTEDLEQQLEENHLLDEYPLDGEFVFYCKAGKGKTEGLFYLIRNALAHGSFRFHSTKQGAFLALETRRNGALKGRALITIASLKKWRKLLNSGQKTKVAG